MTAADKDPGGHHKGIPYERRRKHALVGNLLGGDVRLKMDHARVRANTCAQHGTKQNLYTLGQPDKQLPEEAKHRRAQGREAG